MLLAVVAIVLAYLLGAVPGGLVGGRLAGVDLRRHGSGSAGATNALRARGPAFAAAVFLFDVLKGVVAAALLPRIAPAAGPWLPAACAAAAVVGHVFPVWFGFRGGKGFATALGAIAVLSPLALAPMLGLWVLALVLTGYVSLATLASMVAYPVFVGLWPPLREPPLIALAAFLAVFLCFSHRENLDRLVHGRENRFERVRLVGRGRR